MKKALTLFGLLLLLGFGFQAQASKYKIDQVNLDQMINSGRQIETLSVFNMPDLGMTPDNQVLTEGKDPIIALVLCTVIGWVGAHRYYLGTNMINGLWYFLLSMVAVGGIIVLVDWVMLLMVVIDKKDLAPFIDNPKLIMWKDQL
jgi:TM2 domain-containing membrane protein YozV